MSARASGSAGIAVRVVVRDTAEDAGAAASDHVLALLSAGRPLLGVATGSSPEPLYRALSRSSSRERVLSEVSAFALDEYVGLPASSPQSYRAIVARHVTGPLGLRPDRVHVPDGQAADPRAAAHAYEEEIAAVGGMEVQILGVGRNGHIGFNEPGSPRDSQTRVVALAEETRDANSRFFDSVDDVPRRAITQGIATIMSAAHLVIVAEGRAKAQAVAAALRGPIGPRMPASFVREHPDAVFFLDRAAAALLD